MSRKIVFKSDGPDPMIERLVDPTLETPMGNDLPILTPDLCEYIHDGNSTEKGLAAYRAVVAIEQGRTVVVSVMTGDEAMSAFYEFLDAQPGGVPDRLEFFLAALRHAGVLK